MSVLYVPRSVLARAASALDSRCKVLSNSVFLFMRCAQESAEFALRAARTRLPEAVNPERSA